MKYDDVLDQLMGFIEVRSQIQDDGKKKWTWAMIDEMAEKPSDIYINRECYKYEWDFRFNSFESARNFAFGWIRRHRKDLYQKAVREAKRESYSSKV